ncbi:MAG: hypothetical protein Q7W44_09615 [Coriobacteriia bacterium]|nr:hypothetical protein [Coriobacteriia bacterium]
MRRLTLTGFLKSYARELAGEDTLALSRLVAHIDSEPRLIEPLLLLSATTGSARRLARLLDSRPALLNELATLTTLHESGALETVLSADDGHLRPEYAKVWRSYVARRDAVQRDADIRLEVRQRLLILEQEKSVTRYRMAKDLGLNPGNLHAFLAQGNPTKISLDRVAELLRYLEAA